MKIIFLIISFVCLFSQLSWAFTTQVEVPWQELQKASYEVLASEGIYREKEEGHYIESKWINDEVKKKSRLLNNILPPQNYTRRYRIGVRTKVLANATEIQVLGIFQRKLKKSGKQAPWRFYKIDVDEYAIEKEFFMKILRQVEANRV